MKNKIIDVHIEKTAGRSKRQLFIDTFGADKVLHYDCSTDQLLQSDRRLLSTEKPLHEYLQNRASNRLFFPFIKAGYVAMKYLEKGRGFAPEDITVDFDVVTGHITGDRFAEIITPQSASYTSVLRNPLDRTYSHYQHWARSRGLARFRFMPEYSPNVSFEDFALLPEFHNYQSSAIGIDPAQLEVIGISHNLPDYFEELGMKQTASGVPHLNKSSYAPIANLDIGFVSDFVELNNQDYELYYATCDRWNTSPQQLVS